MDNESFLTRLQRLPVPLLPTMVGAATLSNVFAGHGYDWIRHITMIASTFIICIYIIKIVKHPKVCIGEYNNTVLASLYAGFTMLLMILGSYYFTYMESLGKLLWYIAVILHIAHIIIFTIRNVMLSRNLDTFVPSWFVTYNGLLVSCVVGVGIGHPKLLELITYYGIVTYSILIPTMVWRLWKHEIKDGVYHTQAIVLAPCSLCVVAYLNAAPIINPTVLYALYTCVLLSLLFIILKLPKFFSYAFTPAFAGLTFPMAIGIVASMRTAGYLVANNMTNLAYIVMQISGIQIYLTTGIIVFVLFNFSKMAARKDRKNIS